MGKAFWTKADITAELLYDEEIGPRTPTPEDRNRFAAMVNRAIDSNPDSQMWKQENPDNRREKWAIPDRDAQRIVQAIKSNYINRLSTVDREKRRANKIEAKKIAVRLEEQQRQRAEYYANWNPETDPDYPGTTDPEMTESEKIDYAINLLEALIDMQSGGNFDFSGYRSLSRRHSDLENLSDYNIHECGEVDAGLIEKLVEMEKALSDLQKFGYPIK